MHIVSLILSRSSASGSSTVLGFLTFLFPRRQGFSFFTFFLLFQFSIDIFSLFDFVSSPCPHLILYSFLVSCVWSFCPPTGTAVCHLFPTALFSHSAVSPTTLNKPLHHQHTFIYIYLTFNLCRPRSYRCQFVSKSRFRCSLHSRLPVRANWLLSCPLSTVEPSSYFTFRRPLICPIRISVLFPPVI